MMLLEVIITALAVLVAAVIFFTGIVVVSLAADWRSTRERRKAERDAWARNL